MSSWLGSNFVDANGNKVGAEGVDGYKLIMILHTASWWPGCTPFKNNLKTLYAKWNADGAKNLQVVVLSGDSNSDGFKTTMSGAPWIAIPFG